MDVVLIDREVLGVTLSIECERFYLPDKKPRTMGL